MQVSLNIDGKSVPFRKSGATMLAYKMQTGREFYADLSAFLLSMRLDEAGKVILKENGMPDVDVEKLNIECLYSMLHVMARSADKNVPADILEWLDTFEEFPVISIFSRLLPMINNEMKIDEKNSLTAAENPQGAAI